MKKTFLKKCIGFAAGVAMLAAFTGCGNKDGSSSQKLTKVTMVSPTAVASLDLCWLYAADGLGYFEEEGIKLELIECTDGSDTKMLASGQAAFGGFAPAIGLTSIAAGATNVKAIVNTVSCNMFGFAYNKELGVDSFDKIAGKEIGAASELYSVIYDPILAAAGVDPSTVKYIAYGSAEYEALARGQVPVMGTWLSEYYMCQGMGYDWGYLSGNDVLPQIANSLWVNTDYAAKNPEIVKKFAKIIQKSMYACYANPEVVADIVLVRYPSIEVTWNGAVGAVKGNVSGMFGIDSKDADAKVASKEIGFFEMPIVDQTIQNLVTGGALKEPLESSKYYSNEYVTKDIDYAKIDADLAAYEFKSKVYKSSH